MRLLALFGIVATSLVGLLLAAPPDAPPEPPLAGFAVHEWGVFSVNHELATMNADRRAAFEELPKFVYGQTTTRALPHHWDRPTTTRKPVVFFHAPRPLEVHMSVRFPGGTPLVWWPATEAPALVGNRVGTETKPDKLVNELTWKLYLQKTPGGQKTAGLKEVGSGHWFKALRAVQADEVFVGIGQRGAGFESDQFVYYDGLIPRGKGATVKVEQEHVSLTNEAKYALLDVTVIDRRISTKPRVVRVAKLEAGATQEADWQDATEAHWPEKAARTLLDQLKDMGLNEDEAKALVVVWTREFFEADGVTLCYRLPQEEYARLLPLTLKPRPEKLVRVGLVHQAHCEPGVAERVAALVQQLDNDEFAKREAAQKELQQLGHAAFPYLAKLRLGITAPEVKRRVEELLEKYDVERTIKK